MRLVKAQEKIKNFDTPSLQQEIKIIYTTD